jgi:plasmid stabilization system protein ParE
LAAVEEMERAIDWYRQHDERVAERLIQLIKKRLREIRAKPRLWAPDESGFRSVGVGPFPYRIVYQLHRTTVIFVAFAHVSRQTGYWRSRMR